MATKLSILKRDLRSAAQEAKKYCKATDFLIDIAAGYGLAHFKLVVEIENLETAVERGGLEIDATSTVDEAIKQLPGVSEKYYESLVRLGLVELPAVAAPPENKVNKKNEIMNDEDAVAALFETVNQRSND